VVVADKSLLALGMASDQNCCRNSVVICHYISETEHNGYLLRIGYYRMLI